jgi:hypothetical protein
MATGYTSGQQQQSGSATHLDRQQQHNIRQIQLGWLLLLRVLVWVTRLRHSLGQGMVLTPACSESCGSVAHPFRVSVPHPAWQGLPHLLAGFGTSGTAVSYILCMPVTGVLCPVYLPPLLLHRSKISSWHLAYTRVTPAAVDLLVSCPDIVLLDLRGSGVRAAQLGTLRSKYALSAVQGAVLSRTAAMVLAAVTLDQFVCCDAAQHGAAVAEIRVGQAAAGQQSVGLQHWVNEGVCALLQAAAEAPAAALQPQAVHSGGQHWLGFG